MDMLSTRYYIQVVQGYISIRLYLLTTRASLTWPSKVECIFWPSCLPTAFPKTEQSCEPHLPNGARMLRPSPCSLRYIHTYADRPSWTPPPQLCIANMKTPTAINGEESTNINSLSISQLIRTQPRERLFVHPLMWTARHLGLLRCNFFHDKAITIAPLPPPPPPTTPPATLPSPPDSVPADDDGAGELQRYLASINSDASAACRLATCGNAVTKGYAISKLLGELKCYRWVRESVPVDFLLKKTCS